MIQIGTHPWHSGAYSGFWRPDADYSLLTDGANTFVNAPSSAGSVLIRNTNEDKAIFTRYSMILYVPADIRANLHVQGVSTLAGDATVFGGLTASGASQLRGGLAVNGGASVRGATTLHDGATIAGQINLNGFLNSTSGANFEGSVLTVNDDDGTWTGVFNGTKYGLASRGSSYAMYAVGPIYGTSNLTIAGNAYKSGGGVWGATSDRRVKKDVTAFRPGLAEIEKVRPVRFKYNGLGGTVASDKEYVGVLAQDLEQIAPHMVSSQKKKLRPTDKALADIKSVDGSAFTYMLVNAVQELSQQNKEMQKLVCQDHPTAAFCGTGKHLTQR